MAKRPTLLDDLGVKYTLHHMKARYDYLAWLSCGEHEFNDEVRNFISNKALRCIDMMGKITLIIKEAYGDKYNKDLDKLKTDFWGMVD